jgi:hypothetical protein
MLCIPNLVLSGHLFVRIYCYYIHNIRIVIQSSRRLNKLELACVILLANIKLAHCLHSLPKWLMYYSLTYNISPVFKSLYLKHQMYLILIV